MHKIYVLFQVDGIKYKWYSGKIKKRLSKNKLMVSFKDGDEYNSS